MGQVNAVRVGIRDGQPVMLKRCHGCGQVKIASVDRERSEFPLKRVDHFGPRCWPCQRTYDNEATRRRRRDPRSAELMRAAGRRWRERKRESDPTYWRDISRMRRAMARGAALPERPPSGPSAGVRYPVAPFVEWLGEYERLGRFTNRQDVAFSLDMCERRVRSLLAGQQAHVTLDLVDAALINSVYVVVIDGRAIHSVEDLYGEDEFPWGSSCPATFAALVAA